jgi:Methyltransferase FkbM domain
MNVFIRREIVTNGQHELPKLDLRSSWKLYSTSQLSTEITSQKGIAIDELVADEHLERVNLIKIDVDGYDFKVLHGASSTILRLRPLLFTELCEYTLNEQGDSIKDILTFLNSMGYSAHFDNLKPINHVDEVLEIVQLSGSINGVFLPTS